MIVKHKKIISVIVIALIILILCSMYIMNQDKKDNNQNKYEMVSPIIGELEVNVVGSGVVIPRDIDNEDYSDLEFQIEVDEVDVPKIDGNMQAVIILNAFEERNFEGTVKEIAMEGDVMNDISTFKVILSIDEEIEKLRAGMTGYASILAEKKENVMYVPIEGVYNDGKDKYVIIQSGDKYEKVIVETGINNEDYIEIKSGLTEENDIQLPIERDTNYINKFVPKIFRG